MEKERYGEEELMMFKEVILKKLAVAKEEFEKLKKSLSDPSDNGLDDNMSAYKALEDGAATLEREQVGLLAARQKKFIDNLEAALVRIEQKNYGICRDTGKLISKERLLAVPHTTQSIEAKNKRTL